MFLLPNCFTSNLTEDKFRLLICFHNTDKKGGIIECCFSELNSDLSYFFTPFSYLENESSRGLNNIYDNNKN